MLEHDQWLVQARQTVVSDILQQVVNFKFNKGILEISKNYNFKELWLYGIEIITLKKYL